MKKPIWHSELATAVAILNYFLHNYKLCLASYIILFLISAITESLTALFFTAGINSQAFLSQQEWGVTVAASVIQQLVGSARWQIHELPVDLSVDPKMRCRSNHVGRLLYSGVVGWDSITGVTTTSLVLHSVVIIVDDEPITCGTIVPFALPTSTATIEFNSGAFGRIYIIQWPGEQCLRSCKRIACDDCTRNVHNHCFNI